MSFAIGHLFPRIAARDIIAALKLIDGDAVWGDQRKFELPTSGVSNGVAGGHHWTSDSYV